MTISHNIRVDFPPLPLPRLSAEASAKEEEERGFSTATGEARRVLTYGYNAVRWPRHPLIVTGQPQGSFSPLLETGETTPASTVEPTIPPNLLDITLVGLDRKTVPLKDFFNQGKIVVIVFWATWCHPCLLEITELNKINSEFGKKVVIVSIAQQASQAYDKGIANVPEKPNYLVFSDPSKEIYQTFFPNSQGDIPATVIYTSDGNMVFTSIGYTPNKIFKEITTFTSSH